MLGGSLLGRPPGPRCRSSAGTADHSGAPRTDGVLDRCSSRPESRGSCDGIEGRTPAPAVPARAPFREYRRLGRARQQEARPLGSRTLAARPIAAVDERRQRQRDVVAGDTAARTGTRVGAVQAPHTPEVARPWYVKEPDEFRQVTSEHSAPGTFTRQHPPTILVI